MSYGLAILQKSSENGTCLSFLIVYHAKNTNSLLEKSGDFGDSWKLNSNTAPQGAHILLGVLSENIRGWGGIPRSEKEKK